MKKARGKDFDKVLQEKLKDDHFRFLYDQRRFYLEVAHMVAELRAKRALTQEELAKKAGVSQPMIARLEKGDQRRIPTFETLHKILHALGYTLELFAKEERGKSARAA